MKAIIFHFFPTETARNPTIGRPSSFDVDTSGAGLGELAIQCRGPVGNVPVDVKPTAPGRYNVSFTPNKPGEYNIHFVFNGDDIPGSPVKTIVSDPSRIVAHGDGLHQVRRQVLFIIIPLSSFGSLGQTRFFAVISVTTIATCVQRLRNSQHLDHRNLRFFSKTNVNLSISQMQNLNDSLLDQSLSPVLQAVCLF